MFLLETTLLILRRPVFPGYGYQDDCLFEVVSVSQPVLDVGDLDVNRWVKPGPFRPASVNFVCGNILQIPTGGWSEVFNKWGDFVRERVRV